MRKAIIFAVLLMIMMVATGCSKESALESRAKQWLDLTLSVSADNKDQFKEMERIANFVEPSANRSQFAAEAYKMFIRTQKTVLANNVKVEHKIEKVTVNENGKLGNVQYLLTMKNDKQEYVDRIQMSWVNIDGQWYRTKEPERQTTIKQQKF